MTHFSQSLAKNIANRPRELSTAERLFAHLNAAADAVGVMRMGVVKAAVSAANGIGFLRVKATEAALEAHNARAGETEVAPAVVPKVIQKRWIKGLKKMGKFEVNHWLEQSAHLPSNAPFTYIDTGIIHGATRFPTRDFAIDWAADAPEDDGGDWRVILIGLTAVMIFAGLLLWFLS